MGNCLVTRLPGAVSNNSLLKLGELLINVSSLRAGASLTDNERAIYLKGPAEGSGYPNIEVTAEGKTFTAVGVGDVTSFSLGSSPQKFIFPEGEYNIHLLGKYGFPGIDFSGSTACSSFYKVNLDDFKYCASNNRVFFQKCAHEGEYNPINEDWDTITMLYLIDASSPSDAQGYVNIDHFSNNDVITSLRIRGKEGNKTYGNISSIKSPALTELTLHRCSLVTGTLESMLDNIYAEGEGKTSGQITLDLWGSGVTYQGNPITVTFTATFTANGWSVA